MDRRQRLIHDEAGVIARFGVAPTSIPDYLALIGDAADGYPGLRGWGAKSTAGVLSRFSHLEAIPLDSREWRVNVMYPAALAKTLAKDRDKAFLFRDLATLRTDIQLFDSIEELRWNGPTTSFASLAARLDSAVTLRGSEGPRIRVGKSE